MTRGPDTRGPDTHLAVHVQEAVPGELVAGRGEGAGAHAALPAAGPRVRVVAGRTRGHGPPARAARLPLVAGGAGLAGEAGVASRTQALNT